MKNVVICCCLLFSGCASQSPWQVRTDNMPLTGQNHTAVAKWRFVRGWADGMSPTGGHEEYEWEDSHGRRIDPYAVVQSIGDYFRDTGLLETFRSSGSWVDGSRQMVPQHRICIISLKPTIVLMIPHDFGQLQNRSNNDIRGDFSQWGHPEYLDCLLDGVYTGTDFPYTQGVMWFNSNSRSAPAAIERSSRMGSYMIESGGAIIQLTIDGGRIFARRNK